MAAIAPITLFDGSSTSHTFSPDRILGDTARYLDKSGGIPIGYPLISVNLRDPVKGSRLYRCTVKIAVPTLEQTSPSTATGIQPAPTKAFDCMAVIEFILPERSSSLDRGDILAYCQGILGSPVIANMVNNFERVY